jgi:hypothetical protein
MAVRTDIRVDWNVSPRIVQVDSPSTTLVLQDLVDTLRDIEDGASGTIINPETVQQGQAMTEPHLINAAGKEDLGGGVSVGITAALQDAQLSFEARNTATSSGTHDGGNNSASLIDSGADFVNDGITRGDTVTNNADGSTADVLTVATNELTFRDPLTGGTDDDFDNGDGYDVYKTVQMTISGGNLTAVDTDGSTPINAIQPTAFTQVLLAQASQSTLVVTGSGVLPGDITAIADAVWDETGSDHVASGTAGRYQADQNYMGAVHIDSTNGSAGTTVGVNGTATNPVDTLADAVTLAASLGLRRYTVRGSITLLSAHDDWVFEGRGGEAVIALGGQDVADSEFILCELSGAATADPIVAIDCLFDGVSNFRGTMIRCRFNGTNSFSAGTSNLVDCYSQVPGTSAPVFDCIGAGRSLNVRGYAGGFDLRNSTDAGQSTSIDMVSGQVILNANNTAGTIVIRGVGTLRDNSAGATVLSADYVQNSKLLTVAKFLGLK